MEWTKLGYISETRTLMDQYHNIGCRTLIISVDLPQCGQRTLMDTGRGCGYSNYGLVECYVRADQPVM